jgi:HEPN domain-containing protein
MTAGWVRKAEADHQLAAKVARESEPYHDQLCFLCQQASEKYLKALLEELAQPIPRTHILHDLLGLLLPHHPSLRPLGRGLRFLTRFAVGTRYPGFNASRRQSEAALRWADRVRATARALLGIRPRHAGRKRSQ